MKNTSVRPTDSIEAVMHTYGNMLFRLCLITLGNVSDAEDGLFFVPLWNRRCGKICR